MSLCDKTLPLKYERISSNKVKVICETNGQKKETVVKVFTAGTYFTQGDSTQKLQNKVANQ